ncbi:MAG: tetratricopeptide (TPR) repeat protein [Luteibaculaceae bacterium]|jgi:tetratricopeptide (TPR) repeat protein
MKMTLVVRSYFLLMMLVGFSALSQTKKEKAQKMGIEAVQIMDEGDYNTSIKMLKKARKLDPESIHYDYEIAYALYSQKKYKKAIKILEKIIVDPEAVDVHFQLLGNAYDLIGMPDKAILSYVKGQAVFPQSGKLYLEPGIVEYYRENYDKAISYWEKGISVEPNFASNYFWLGRTFSFSDELIWSVLYGEIFMNLERNTKRTVEMSEILFKSYSKAIQLFPDSVSVNFSNRFELTKDDLEIFPFSMTYGINMVLSATISLLDRENNNITIRDIHDIRSLFLANWFEKGNDSTYTNVLFDFQREISVNGFMEPYGFWLLMKGNEEAFGVWYEENETLFNAFAEWFNKIDLEIDVANYFSRAKK